MPPRRPGVTSILQSVEMRGETDTRPSYAVYAVLPIALVAVGVAILFGGLIYLGDADALSDPDASLSGTVLGLFGIYLLLALVGGALHLVGLYKLIKRRNEHLDRDRILGKGLVEVSRDLAGEDPPPGTAEELERMERAHNQALLEENERSAALHLILGVFIPFWMFYVFYFLLKDIPRHARRQARLTTHASAVFEASGRGSLPRIEPVQERSFLLSLVLILFLPLVGQLVFLYWIFNDPHEHFDRQWAFEDALLSRIQADEEGEDPASDQAGQDDGGDEPDQQAPAFTVWTCQACEKKYKVPPKRPVRVTCKNCGNQEILRE